MNNVIKYIPHIAFLAACAAGYLVGRRSKSNHSRELPPDSASTSKEMDADMHPPPQSYWDSGWETRLKNGIVSEVTDNFGRQFNKQKWKHMWSSIWSAVGVGVFLLAVQLIIDRMCT